MVYDFLIADKIVIRIMTPDELKKRTMQLGIDVITICEKLLAKAAGKVVGIRMIRCATYMGANSSSIKREVKPQFINKIAIVLEELDETQYWLELSVKSGLLKKSDVASFRSKDGWRY
jgi:four helix bundle protein